MAIVRVLLILMVLIHVVDFGCTMRYLTPDTELNPVAAKVWEIGGSTGLVALKTFVLLVVVGCVELIGRVSSRLALAVTLVAVFISCVPLVMFGLIWALP